jgi:hypothetical protein
VHRSTEWQSAVRLARHYRDAKNLSIAQIAQQLDRSLAPRRRDQGA